jgi:hypothetical protein
MYRGVSATYHADGNLRSVSKKKRITGKRKLPVLSGATARTPGFTSPAAGGDGASAAGTGAASAAAGGGDASVATPASAVN